MLSIGERMGRFFNGMGVRLVPNWRWLLILAASCLLLESESILAPTSGHIPPGWSILGVAGSILAFALLWAATRPAMPHWLARLRDDLPPIARHRAWALLFVPMAFYMILQIFATHQVIESLQGFYRIDAVAYAHIDVELVLHGKNPFTDDAAFWEAYRRWPQALSTPIMGGAFGNNPLVYPHNWQIDNVLHLEAAHPGMRGSGFDPATVHNYPAGILWLALPLVWAGLPSILWLSLLAWAGAIALVLARTPARERGAALFVLILSPVAFRTVLSNFDIVSLVFVLAAWHWMGRRTSSALLMGFACAIKQTAWFFLPFYFVDVYRREGWRGVLRRGLWSALAFLLPNLPFILASPVEWFKSIWLPLTDPMFPIGVGAVALAFGGLLPILTPHIWTLLEVLVFGGLLVSQYRRSTIVPDSLLLALVPLWFAWRSPLNYFAWMPLMAAWLAATQLSLGTRLARIRPAETAAALPLPLSESLEGVVPEAAGSLSS